MYLSYHLFMRPGQEIPEGSEVNEFDLHKLGTEVKSRIENAQYITRQLEKRGFVPFMGKYEIMWDHKELEEPEEINKAIEEVGLDPKVFEFVEED